MKRLFLAAPLLLVAACAPKSAPNTLDDRMVGTFNWMCTGDVPATVVFHADSMLADLTLKGETIQLHRQSTTRGFIYQFGATQINGSAQRMQISSPQFGNLDCRPN